MASLENKSSRWRLLDCLGHWTGICQMRQVVPVAGHCRNRDSRDSGFSSSCSKAATQVKHSPFASFVLDLMMPVCACIGNDVVYHYAWSHYQLCNIMHEVTTNYVTLCMKSLPTMDSDFDVTASLLELITQGLRPPYVPINTRADNNGRRQSVEVSHRSRIREQWVTMSSCSEKARGCVLWSVDLYPVL